MTEEEAAAKLAALLNEIQAAGHQVAINDVNLGLWVGNHFMFEPTLDDGIWVVES